MHSVPVLLHCCHWKPYVIGSVPVQVPSVAFSVCPVIASPTTIGAIWFEGFTPAIVAVAADCASPLPAMFVAITFARSVWFTSAP